MLQGQSFVLVVGGADTGRSPLVAALLRRALPGVHIRSAGVVSHDGEPADSLVGLALSNLGVAASTHHARPIDLEELRQADLLLAVDRGTARVLQAQLPQDARVVALSELAGSADVIDPHRMPLGVWIAAARDFDTQLKAALPQLRERLGIRDNVQSPQVPPPTAAVKAPSAAPEGAADDRAPALARIIQLIETAQVLPDIVDWSRLRAEVSDRLRVIATLNTGPTDFTPAATMMIDGLLAHTSTTPSPGRLAVLRSAVHHLGGPIDGGGLAALGSEVARWGGE